MIQKVYSILTKKYPQNYLLRNPFIGTLIVLLFSFLFVIIYKPLYLKESRFFNFELTMVVYLCATSTTLLGIALFLRRSKYFSKEYKWTLLKELILVVGILLVMGIVTYFLGFLLETPGKRWNVATFLDSCKIAFLIGIFPLLFFTIINYQYLFVTETIQNFETVRNNTGAEQFEELIHINSKLKKEELSFYPNQFIYSEAAGNYVIFHLEVDQKIRKEMIRNSISNIEKQLSGISYIIRTHRAFIVNIRKLHSQKGNTLGYRLKLNGTEDEIPVSRQRAHDFILLLKLYQ